MGTGFEEEGPPGIIPRAVGHLFDGIEERRRKAMESGEPPPEFKVNAHFMEVGQRKCICGKCGKNHSCGFQSKYVNIARYTIFAIT